MYCRDFILWLYCLAACAGIPVLHAQTPQEKQASRTRTAAAASPRESGRDSSGRVLHNGPHGGRYFLNEKGERVYVGKAGLEGSVPEKDAEGHIVFTGPKGGKYYFDEQGRKVYIRKQKPKAPAAKKQPGK